MQASFATEKPTQKPLSWWRRCFLGGTKRKKDPPPGKTWRQLYQEECAKSWRDPSRWGVQDPFSSASPCCPAYQVQIAFARHKKIDQEISRQMEQELLKCGLLRSFGLLHCPEDLEKPLAFFSDSEIAKLYDTAKKAGARSAGWICDIVESFPGLYRRELQRDGIAKLKVLIRVFEALSLLPEKREMSPTDLGEELRRIARQDLSAQELETRLLEFVASLRS